MASGVNRWISGAKINIMCACVVSDTIGAVEGKTLILREFSFDEIYKNMAD